MKKILKLLALILTTQLSFAQVQEINYALEYDAETCFYNCYMVVEKGYARDIRQRVQFNSQITIVTPRNAEVVVEEVYNPLQNNQNYRSGQPADWFISNIIKAPSSEPESAFYSITPVLSPSSFYNDLMEGEKVLLFSLSISADEDCGSGIRIFRNGIDPSSSDPGMGGSDFSNGFTMGGLDQLYRGNHAQVNPAAPVIEDFKFVPGTGKSIMRVRTDGQSACQGSLTYHWYAPSGEQIGSGPDFVINPDSYKNGSYKMVVSDKLGCKDEVAFNTMTGVSTIGSTVADHQNELTSSVTENEIGAFSFSIYPNPAKESINLTVNGNAGDPISASVYDANGREIKKNLFDKKLTNDTQEINVPLNLSSGVYSLTLTNGNTSRSVSQKLIVID